MNEMMSSGVELMLIGMGIVFLFLAMLVVAIKFMTAMIARYFPEIPDEFVISNPSKATESLLIAAVTAAVHQYRNQHK